MACPVVHGTHIKPTNHPHTPSKTNIFILKLRLIIKKYPFLITLCKGLSIVGIIWSIRGLILIYRKYKQSSTILLIIGILYYSYHCYQVHRYLKWHKLKVQNIIKRAKMKKQNGIQPKNTFDYTYSESVSEKQFNSNMEYFKNNRDKRGGFYSSQPIMATFSESCTFLGGARAALLQVAHPFIAISVKKHSYIIKQSKMNKIINAENNNIDMIDDCDYKLLSTALKSRFNRTFGVLFPIIYGPLNKSISGAKRAWIQHKQIKGKLIENNSNETIGDSTIFNKNTYYSATMTTPLRWVWSTLTEGAMFTQQLMGILPYKDLSKEQIDFYNECYKSAVNTAMAFGLNKNQIPSTIEEFEEDYWFNMMESKHIEISKDCSRWCKVFFMANNWYSKPTIYALKCYTTIIFPESVRNKFNKYDPNLLPFNNFIYFYGILWLGLSRSVYILLPKSVRLLNDYMEFKERINGENHYNKFQKFMKMISGHIANLIVYSFIEG
eukprot:414978_1